MAKIQEAQPLIPSVLDRLLDFEPEVSREAPRNRHQVLRELKQAVRRDLENLLNSRTRVLPWPTYLKELPKSLVNYGLPDFTGASMGSAKDREDLCRLLQTVIRQHEPRFKTVRVTLLSNAEPLDRTLRFRIDALLYADPAPEPIVFDSVLKPGTGAFEVKGETS
ncbi:MAG: type VI secretion system baseplate subunit TssE [Planctomycetes bacterium]|nr:type VI secretion system baseplate subunit TssE [Planctomycetota bacterium]